MLHHMVMSSLSHVWNVPAPRRHSPSSEIAPVSPREARLLTVTKLERQNNDANDRLLFQQQLDFIKFQGRERELDDLRNAFDRVSRNEQCELVLVHGVSGCGKNSLLAEFRSTLVPKGGCIFAEGTFDPLLHSSDAFDVIINACNQLCSLVTGTNEGEIRAKLNQRLGFQATILSKQMPALAKILMGVHESSRSAIKSSPSPSNCEDTPDPIRADLARIKGLYQLFLNCLCSCYTVVLFLNDLQWSDDTSRQLVQALASDSNSKHLLIIGAYRYESTIQQEKLEKSLLCPLPGGERIDTMSVRNNSSTRDAPVQVVRIALENFNLPMVNDFVKQVTRTKQEDTLDFAKLVYQTTNGNPYFIKQYLGLLHSRGALTRNEKTDEWDYDLEKIGGESVGTETVVKILSEKVNLLPESVRDVLHLASYLGHRFSADILERFDERNSAVSSSSSALHRLRIANAISVGLREGLLEKVEAKLYKFSHNSVQESLYTIIENPRDQEKFHLRIGRTLVHSCTETSNDCIFLQAVDNLNRGSAHIQRLTEKEELIRWNLQAARLAASKMSFQATLGYLRKGIGLMDEHKWVRHYSLSLDIFNMAADMELATANFSRCTTLMKEVHLNATSVDDCISVYVTEVAMVGRSGDLGGAITLGMSILKELGEPVPALPSRRRVFAEFLKAKRAIRRRSDVELLGMSRMADQRKLACMKLLSSLVVPSYLWDSGKNIFIMTLLRMVRLSCKYGLSLESPLAFCGMGVINASFGFYDEAVRFGDLALQMIDVTAARNVRCLVLYIRSTMANVWRVPFIETLDPLFQAFHSGIAYSDLEPAYLSAVSYLWCCFTTGTHLDRVIEGCRKYIAEMEEYQLSNMLWLILPMLQSLEKLRGNEKHPHCLAGEIFDYESLVAALVANKQILAQASLRKWEAWLMYFFDRCDDHLPNLLTFTNRHRKVFDGHMNSLSIRLVVGCGCYTMYNGTGRRKYMAMGRKCVRELTALSTKGVLMADAPALLLNANMLSMSPSCSREVAETAYQNAIVAAQKTQQPLLEGDAYTRLIPIMLKDGDEGEALRLFQNAVRVYEDTGQMARIKYLIDKHVNLANNLTQSTFPSSALQLDFDPSISFLADVTTRDNISYPNAPIARDHISRGEQGGTSSSQKKGKSYPAGKGSRFTLEMSSTNTVWE